MLLTRQEFSVYRQINGTDVFIQKANKLRTGITTLAQREGSGPCLFFCQKLKKVSLLNFDEKMYTHTPTSTDADVMKCGWKT